MIQMENEVQLFYDDFTTKQLEQGICLRNIRIQEWTEKFGLKETDNVLEIGCGIGSQTELLAKFVVNGKITAVDLSPKCIQIAKERLKKFKNISLLTGDILTIPLPLETKFDVIVLPDVLEHIPLEGHFKLFATLSSLLKNDGFIVIHIPNPNFLAWCIENKKEVLQIIDQPIYTDVLCSNVYPNNLYIHYIETYEIWQPNCDYQVIILKSKKSANHYPEKIYKSTFFQKAVYKLKLILGLKRKK